MERCVLTASVPEVLYIEREVWRERVVGLSLADGRRIPHFTNKMNIKYPFWRSETHPSSKQIRRLLPGLVQPLPISNPEAVPRPCTDSMNTSKYLKILLFSRFFTPLQNRSFFLTFNCRIAAFWPSVGYYPRGVVFRLSPKPLPKPKYFHQIPFSPLSVSLGLSQPLSASLNPLSTLSQPLSVSLGDYRPHNHHQSPRAVSEARRVRHYVQGTPSLSFVLSFFLVVFLFYLCLTYVSLPLFHYLSLDEELYAWTCTSVF